MRTPVLALAVLFGTLMLAAPSDAALAATTGSVEATAALQAQPPDVDIEVGREGGAWYGSPMWLAIGAIALIVVIMLIVMAARGGGTTVVRD